MKKKHTKQRCPDFAAILRDTPATSPLIEQIVTCYYLEMSRVANLRCLDEVVAEDVTQDAIVKALSALDSYRGDGPLQGWLCKLVVTACSRLRRGRKNSPAFNRPLVDVDDPALADASSGKQELRVLLNERLAIVGGEIEQVDPYNRTLLLLHEGQDVPLAALADDFQISEDAVKSRLKRTRALLRERLLKRAAELVEA